MVQQIIKAGVAGQCAGIRWAMTGAEFVVQQLKFDRPTMRVFAYPIGHNQEIIDWMKKLGITVVQKSEDVPTDALYLVSAHGCATMEIDRLTARGVIVANLTCPLVAKNHLLISHALKEAHTEVVVIGHSDHQEMRGYVGDFSHGIHCVEDERGASQLVLNAKTRRLVIVLQTTLSYRDFLPVSQALKKRFKHLEVLDRQGRCYATINRQDALLRMINEWKVDTVVVVGDVARSSNTKRLTEIAQAKKVTVVSTLNDVGLFRGNFKFSHVVGVTAGASALPQAYDAVVTKLERWFEVSAITDFSVEESEKFPHQLFIDQYQRIKQSLGSTP